jgi:hypothetical protein
LNRSAECVEARAARSTSSGLHLRAEFLRVGTNLQTALIWAIGFGTFAFILARQHTQR